MDLVGSAVINATVIEAALTAFPLLRNTLKPLTILLIGSTGSGLFFAGSRSEKDISGWIAGGHGLVVSLLVIGLDRLFSGIPVPWLSTALSFVVAEFVAIPFDWALGWLFNIELDDRVVSADTFYPSQKVASDNFPLKPATFYYPK